MRFPQVHEETYVNFTENARIFTQILNEFKRNNPLSTFRQMATEFGMTETNVRRYYYGIHHYMKRGTSWSQMRKGASVSI